MKSETKFGAWLDWAKVHDVLDTGSLATLGKRGKQGYASLVRPWIDRTARACGLFIHTYSTDSAENFKALGAAGVDGLFINRISELLEFQGRPAAQDVGTLLRRHGY